jgi:hypothetical protein
MSLISYIALINLADSLKINSFFVCSKDELIYVTRECYALWKYCY